jgi:hypothetical protein
MSSIKHKKTLLHEKLERQIIYGLSCEWETALWVLSAEQRRLVKKPLISLIDLRKRLGYWSGEKKEICISRSLVYNHPWDTVREVLLHEMAHQFAEQALGAEQEAPHGPKFKKACHLLRANPKATGEYNLLREKIFGQRYGHKDKIMIRVKKLLALAESKNRHEAEMAMLKAHELIKKYNIDIISAVEDRNFFSVFVGKPTLRHHREEYHLAHLIQDFYFVQGMWVSAYVLEKEKMGRVLELSGAIENIKIASYVYDFVKNFINLQWQRYNKEKKLNRYRKSDFAVGVIEGFRSKLENKYFEKETHKEQFGLIAMEDPQLKEYMKYKYPHTVSFNRSVSSQDENIFKEGQRIGKKLVLFKGVSEKGASKNLLIEKL